MELRSLAVFFGLCLLAVTQCSDARHAIEKRDAIDDDIFAADEASEDVDNSNSEGKNESTIKAVITTLPKTYEVNPGQNVTLECSVDPDNSTVVQWFKNNTMLFMGGMQIDKNPKYSLKSVNSKDLVIKQVDSSDSSDYRCDVVQETDPVQVKHTLIVLESPVINRFTATNNGNLIEGADLLLTCDASGMPPPQIVWTRVSENNENQRLGERDGEFSFNSVYVKSVKREHSGLYYCYAFNNAGHNQAELLISVSGKPRVQVHKTVVNSAINVEAVLQCSARYEANPHIQWYKDGFLISDSRQYIVSTLGGQSNLTVTPTTDADFGTFTCEARNNIGKHNKSIELVQKPVIESVSVESGKLSWIVHSHLPLQEIVAQVRMLTEDGEWKQFDVPLPSERHHKYEIIYDLQDQLSVGKYEAIVKVKNDHSWSDNVEPIIFDIDVQPQFIQHASVFFNDAHSIRPTAIILSTLMMFVFVRLL